MGAGSLRAVAVAVAKVATVNRTAERDAAECGRLGAGRAEREPGGPLKAPEYALHFRSVRAGAAQRRRGSAANACVSSRLHPRRRSGGTVLYPHRDRPGTVRRQACWLQAGRLPALQVLPRNQYQYQCHCSDGSASFLTHHISDIHPFQSPDCRNCGLHCRYASTSGIAAMQPTACRHVLAMVRQICPVRPGGVRCLARPAVALLASMPDRATRRCRPSIACCRHRCDVRPRLRLSTASTCFKIPVL